MMAKRDTPTCPSCGSINSGADAVCDICGHDPRTDIAAPAPASAAPASAAATTRPKQQRGVTKAAAGRSVNTGKKVSGHALFTTTQWIAITVAAFILGGVLSATILSRHEGRPPGDPTQQAMGAEGAQPDMQRLTETRAAMEANPDNPDALLAYSHALHDSGMPAQAIVQYKRYLEFRPDDPDARVDLGICYFETKDFANAISEMERAVATFPDHQLGHYNLGIVNLNAGNKDKARAWFEKARDIDPTSPHGTNATQLLEEHF